MGFKEPPEFEGWLWARVRPVAVYRGAVLLAEMATLSWETKRRNK